MNLIDFDIFSRVAGCLLLLLRSIEEVLLFLFRSVGLLLQKTVSHHLSIKSPCSRWEIQIDSFVPISVIGNFSVFKFNLFRDLGCWLAGWLLVLLIDDQAAHSLFLGCCWPSRERVDSINGLSLWRALNNYFPLFFAARASTIHYPLHPWAAGIGIGRVFLL